VSKEHELLARIASALERLAPSPPPEIDWLAHPAYVWDGTAARALDAIEAPKLELLGGIEAQKARVTENIARLSKAHPAHDMLLWGARGMGKSALVRSAVAAAQRDDSASIALVQVATDALASLSALFTILGVNSRNYLIFIDDLGYSPDDLDGPRHLRSWLEGGIEARPANVRLAVTSNRRAILPRDAGEQNDPLNPRDAVDDKLALADRFGLSLGFHNCNQDDYLAIIGGYANAHGLAWDEKEALEWAKRRGTRSGRTAWQFVTELAGKSGKRL
jgi:uncharacterized protein